LGGGVGQDGWMKNEVVRNERKDLR
jgi:hypothetical protein